MALTDKSTANGKLLNFSKKNSSKPRMKNNGLFSDISCENWAEVTDIPTKAWKTKKIDMYARLDAPKTLQSLNTQLLDWSENGYIWVGLESEVYAYNPKTKEIVKLWELNKVFGSSSKSLQTEHHNFSEKYIVTALKWMPAGKNVIAIAVSSKNLVQNKVLVIDTKTKKVVRELDTHSKPITSLDWNGWLLTSAGIDGEIWLIDISCKNPQIALTTNWVLSIDWDLTGKYFAFGSLSNNLKSSSVWIWDIRKMPLLLSSNPEDEQWISQAILSQELKSHYGIRNVKWSPHDYSMMSATWGNSIMIYNGHNGAKASLEWDHDPHFEDQFITQAIWDKNSQELIVGTSRVNDDFYFENYRDILIKTKPSDSKPCSDEIAINHSLSKFSIKETFQNDSSSLLLTGMIF